MNEQALSQRRIEAARDAIANQKRIEEKDAEIMRLKAEAITNRQSIEELMATIDHKEQQLREARGKRQRDVDYKIDI